MAKDCIDPPPEEVPDEKRAKIAYPDVINGHDESHFPIRKARVSDVENLLELVNGFAAQNLMLPRGPQYIFENIRTLLRINLDTYQTPRLFPAWLGSYRARRA